MDSQPNPTPDAALTPPDPIIPKSWFRQNAVSLVVIAVVLFVVFKFLQPLDVLIAGFGLSLIIFLHELGHFLAAKACNVHVRTFSIGFGPPLPFCSFKYGETTYKLGMIPLGGFVAMVGENTGETDGEAKKDDRDDDPRSFKNKNVLQRMFIISAGVIMNLILAAACFIVAYMNGVEEQVPIVAYVEPGSCAWQAGIRPGTTITKINRQEKPWFDDIRPIVSATHEGEIVYLETTREGVAESWQLSPHLPDEAFFPVLGVAPPESMKLVSSKRDNIPPFKPGSPASKAKNTDGTDTGFLPGDTIIAMSDPTDPNKLTPLEEKPVASADFRQRLAKLAGKTLKFRVKRVDGTEADLTTPPAFRKDLGLRMKMGPITALRVNSPAAKAGVKARVVHTEKELESGDRITAVEVTSTDGKKKTFSVDTNKVDANKSEVELLDPLKLPYRLNQWIDSLKGIPSADRTVRVTVLRDVDHTQKEVTLTLDWDESYREDYSVMQYVSTPVPIGQLGLAYRVTSEVNTVLPGSPAEQAGIKAGDLITQATFKATDIKGEEKTDKESKVENNPKEKDSLKLLRWAFVDHSLQSQHPHKVSLKIDRAGTEIEAKDIQAIEDPSWPVPDTGLMFGKELRRAKAEGVVEALEMGISRTKRAIRATYQGLYGMIAGRIKVQMMSGPITLARTSYIIAGEDIWKLVLIVGLISINLAVVNFLPIPVLDGGHMVFLIYEGIFRRPAPEIVQVILTWIGLIMVLCLMLFTIGLDLWRLWQQYG